MFRRFAWLLLCLPMPAQAAAAGPIQSYDSYKSWLVACDNVLGCEAKGFAENADKSTEMVIDRVAGARGALTLRIRAEGHFALADVRIDDRPAGLRSSDWSVSDDDDGTLITAKTPAVVRAFVNRLRNGFRLTLGESGDVPLDGLTAALLRIDERQGRIGGVTALVRAGAALPTSVPEPPAMPFIPDHPIKATLAPGEASLLMAGVRASHSALFEKEECEQGVSSTDAGAWALDERRALVLIPCSMGAYQGSFLAFIAPRKGGGAAERLILALPYLGSDPGGDTVDILTEGDFDPASGTLWMRDKGRGLGDCGQSAIWTWDGNVFRLSSMTMQNACGGVGAADWPSLFVSKQRLEGNEP